MRSPAPLRTRRTAWMGAAGLWALAAAAHAQTPPPAVPEGPTPSAAAQAPRADGPPSQAPAVDAAQQGVLVFEPAFFADARPDTARDMIARLPGFSLQSGDSDTRGLSGAAGNVLIDGERPASKSDGLAAVLQRISAASVARIELIRGGAPGIDMQGQPVVANVVLRRTVTVDRVFEANAYLYPDGYIGPVLAAQYARRAGDDQIEASVRATSDRTDGTSTGFRRRFDPSGALIQDAELDLRNRIRSVEAAAAWQGRVRDGRLRVNGLAEVGDADDRQITRIRSGAGRDSLNEEHEESLGAELGLNWTGDLTPVLGLELIGLQRYETEDYVGVSTGAGVSTFTSAAEAGESIARAVLRYRPDDRWAVESGGEVAFNFLDSTNALQEDGVPVPLPSDAVRVEELRAEAFGQATWRASPRFTLETGVRVEVSEISQSGDSDLSRTFVYPKPRLQLTWTPGADHQFRLRVEREVGQLDFGDFVASADIQIGQVEGGNPDLEPEKTTIVEAVYERRFWDEGVLAVEASRSWIQDVVDLIPLTGGFDAVGNIGDGRSDFMQLRLTLPTDRLGLANARLDARASWSHTEVVDPLTGETRRFQGNQNFGCNVSFNHDLAGGRWAYGFQHGCNVDRGNRFRIRELRRAVAEPQVSLYGQWKPSPRLTLRADLINVTDRAVGFDRDVFAGPRDQAPLAFRESRRTERTPFLYLQVRRSL